MKSSFLNEFFLHLKKQHKTLYSNTGFLEEKIIAFNWIINRNLTKNSIKSGFSRNAVEAVFSILGWNIGLVCSDLKQLLED